MSAEFLTVAMFTILLLSIALGHPLAYTLAGVATLFGLIDYGFNFTGLFMQFANLAWGLMNNYTLVAIPLFIFMANLLDCSKVSDELFDALYVVLGALKGGLGLAVIGVCTVFAATTGIIGASVVGMTLLAAPPMIQRGYQKELTAGLICSAGSLGILIPPSIMMVVFAGLAGMKETTVGNLFAAAIIPGIVLSGLFMLYTWTRCTLNPSLGPPISKEEAAKYSAAQKWGMTLKSLLPPAALIFAVMGTILMGVATATEAAAMGALGALILALIKRKLTWEVIRRACSATLKTTSMVMLLFIGGTFFSSVFLGMGGGDVVADLLVGSGLNRWVVFFIMMFIVFILGMFIDWAAILLITVPIFLPIAMDIGFDPLWFALVLCVNLQCSFLTPPFGYALFYFAGVAPPGYTMMHIYRGIIPFVILQVIGLILMAVFPSMTLWLPAVFFGR
ncbi:TRAP transporter large permease subunit [Desulfosarcina sp.]|uniref:TRAP transporter large permease n=1 Tax=Desulfosarcina sp. TaxID=2027861 RepID=UPI003970EE8A